MKPVISIIIILARGIERYEQVSTLQDADRKCRLLGGLRWVII